MRPSRLLAVAATAAVAGALAAPSASPAAPAASAAAPTPHVIARHLRTPLSLAVAGRTVYVTQNDAGRLMKVRPGARPTTWFASKGGKEVGGVSVRHHRVAFTLTKGNEQGVSGTWLKLGHRRGHARTVANIYRFEAAHNPDHRIVYGVRNLPADCAAQWPTDQIGPPSYRGAVDSHPYATTQTKHRIYVADAGMNAVVSVSRAGHVRTVAVTPAVRVPITADLAQQFGVPECAVGLTYYGESVPTDVERGPRGGLIVTTLGGGLGEALPLGAIYRVNPRSGHVKRLVGGLATPTGVAVRHNGTMYVAGLFSNEISRIRAGSHRVRTFAKAPLPATAELSGGRLYATIRALSAEKAPPRGMVVRYSR
jgi:DNA-binding beta-propeller fold protein YncE